jgi:primosomal protein N' (replication factor Y)
MLERGMEGDPLTYGIPDAMPDLAPGDRVLAPLGAGNRPTPGVVASVSDTPDIDPRSIKVLVGRVGSRLPADLVEVARWMAAYYCCPLGMAVATVVPAAVKKGTGRVIRTLVERVDAEPAATLGPRTDALWRAIDALPLDAFPIDAKELAHRLGEKSTAGVTRLVRAGLLRLTRHEGVRARPTELSTAPVSPPPTPSPAQKRAIAQIGERFGSFGAFLLFGVTGSGKTEVYLRAIADCLERGKGAIVLVPEISLTPQTAGRFIGRFGAGRVAVLHSGLTAAQRHREWARIAHGEALVVVGARSAVFAPFDPPRTPPLGMIVVDEEHDSSYKQDQLPRYHARQVAFRRAQIAGCPLILGSATPSLETWAAVRAGHMTRLDLPDRLGGGRLPRVEIVDMAEERRARPGSDHHLHAIGPRLEFELQRTLDEGGQAILLLNRRGFASYIHCPSSGWLMTCPYCDVTMVFHKADRLRPGGVVRCHHCHAEAALPKACPDCGGRLSLFGAGTQRLEAEIERKFPALVEGDTLLRLDSDTMRTAADYFTALDRFGAGEVRVLVGTQMIAKGLDFPMVRLIGVVHADSALHLPDFRSAERTFQLIAQVAGRAGRSAESWESRVIVQTWCPGDDAIRSAAAHDYVGFAERELAQRTRAGLPPATRMVRIVFRDSSPDEARAAARKVYDAATALKIPGLRVRPPAPCALSRIAGFARVALDMIAPKAETIQTVLRELRAHKLVKSDGAMAVDVDPIALL